MSNCIMLAIDSNITSGNERLHIESGQDTVTQ